ncbi:PhoX family protein [Thiomonas intermedia]|uniref:PhoX family protein n=1 Tax=Thiomonas intermedia TaxID=926 RepID=UPI0009A4823D|nr:alkaline phosphatase PhoX [Thiomonas intermedia]
MPPIPANPSRRQALKLFGGVPLIPLSAGLGGSVLLAACGGGGGTANAASPTATAFSAMAAPDLSAPTTMATTSVASALKVAYSDGSSQTYPLGYQAFFITGQSVPDGNGGSLIAGGYFDINGNPIMDTSVAGKERQFFSDAPDGTSLLTVPNAKVADVKGNTVFAVVQFEYTSLDQAGVSAYGTLPSPIAVLTLDQDPATGKLSLVKSFNVPTKPANGLWITCGASLTPWGTHLSSEEYEPDAAAIAKNTQFQAYITNLYGDSNALNDPQKANPYLYGHMPEVTVNPDGTATVVKHYGLGRISHELIQVMPDQRTCLMGDDATNGGLFLFIADKAADLSAGTLYVAQATQTSPAGQGTGTFTLKWINLGHATSDEVLVLAQAAAQNGGAPSIMDVKTADPALATPPATGYTQVWLGGKKNWIKLVPGQEKAAAFLETHRYAGLMGGTMAFTKMEGTTVNAKDKVAYSAMSYIQASMTDGSIPGFKVAGPKAGAVYALNLKGGQADAGGTAMNSDWVPVDMAAPAALVGEDLATPDALGNLANPNKIANPDNIKFSEKLRTLFIGEDSGMHVNNFLWAYNVDTKALSRILSTPSGAESTGLQGVDDVNGWMYVMSNFQHPGDWEIKTVTSNGVTDTTGLHAKVFSTLEPLINASYEGGYGAAVGYITGLPPTAKA